MKINPDDPASKMTIRLDLAKAAMRSLINITESYAGDSPRHNDIATEAFRYADAMIGRANRDEGKVDKL